MVVGLMVSGRQTSHTLSHTGHHLVWGRGEVWPCTSALQTDAMGMKAVLFNEKTQ